MTILRAKLKARWKLEQCNTHHHPHPVVPTHRFIDLNTFKNKFYLADKNYFNFSSTSISIFYICIAIIVYFRFYHRRRKLCHGRGTPTRCRPSALQKRKLHTALGEFQPSTSVPNGQSCTTTPLQYVRRSVVRGKLLYMISKFKFEQFCTVIQQVATSCNKLTTIQLVATCRTFASPSCSVAGSLL